MSNILQFPLTTPAVDKFKVDDAIAGHEFFLPWAHDPKYADEVLAVIHEAEPVAELNHYTRSATAEMLALESIFSAREYDAKDAACVVAHRILRAMGDDAGCNGHNADFLAAYIHYLLKTMKLAMDVVGADLPQSH